MYEEETHGLRRAMASLVEVAMKDLADREGTPHVGRLPDHQRWWRYGQESFAAARPAAWDIPDRAAHYKFLDTFPEMIYVRAAFKAHPVLHDRVDTMLGAEFSRQHRQLGWLIVEHIVEPMVVTARAYTFDDETFRGHFDRLADGLSAAHVRMVEFIPLTGFTSTESSVPLHDGLIVAPMTDVQMSDAIEQAAVPKQFGGGVNGVRVSRFDQWALRKATEYPVRSGHGDAGNVPAAPIFPTLRGPSERLVKALRIIIGGSAVATRPMFRQDDGEFPIVLGCRGELSSYDTSDETRPTILYGPDVDAVCMAYQMLARPAVEADRALQNAIRRLVYAGTRSLSGDRLIDLMTSAEALFVKRASISGSAKKTPISAGAARLLADDPILRASKEQIEVFMTAAYNGRNAEIHGDSHSFEALTLLDGRSPAKPSDAIDDVERLMRRAIYRVLVDDRDA